MIKYIYIVSGVENANDINLDDIYNQIHRIPLHFYPTSILNDGESLEIEFSSELNEFDKNRLDAAVSICINRIISGTNLSMGDEVPNASLYNNNTSYGVITGIDPASSDRAITFNDINNVSGEVVSLSRTGVGKNSVLAYLDEKGNIKFGEGAENSIKELMVEHFKVALEDAKKEILKENSYRKRMGR